MLKGGSRILYIIFSVIFQSECCLWSVSTWIYRVWRNKKPLLYVDQAKRHSQLFRFSTIASRSTLNPFLTITIEGTPPWIQASSSSFTRGRADPPIRHHRKKKFTVFYTLIRFHNPVIIVFVTATAICIDLVPHNRCENVQVAMNPSIKWMDGWMIEQWVNGRRLNGISPVFLALLAVLFRPFRTRGYEFLMFRCQPVP